MVRRLVALCLAVVLTVCVVPPLCNRAEQLLYPRKYEQLVEKWAAAYELDPLLVYAFIRTESGFDPTAVSSAGAVGLMQMMPATFADLTARTGDNYETGMLYDPDTSIRYGVYYLSMLYARYGVWDTAFAAYNCGMGRVDGWIAEGKVDENGKLTGIPLEETANYVARVNRAIEKYEKLYNNESK